MPTSFDSAMKGQSVRDYTPSFIKTVHKTPYPAIDPSLPSLSAAGKTILITGGATGIGLATAHAFAAAGATTIILLARRAPTLATASQALSTSYPSVQILTYATDISSPDAVTATLSSAIQDAHTHALDILITSAAAVTSMTSLFSLPLSEISHVLSTNIVGNIDLVRKFLSHPSSPSAPPKTIIDISSEGGFVVYPTTAAYGASKYGFSFLLRHLAFENPDLRIYSFHPGAIFSPQAEAFGVKKEDHGDAWSDAEVPGRFALWLASEEAVFLKGRFLMAKWDVEELVENRRAFEGDAKLGVI
ncbi:NAD(P)-binding protein, partial [Amniculicola lignicola CBS 123094]